MKSSVKNRIVKSAILLTPLAVIVATAAPRISW
jgi:hypothetical protein